MTNKCIAKKGKDKNIIVIDNKEFDQFGNLGVKESVMQYVSENEKIFKEAVHNEIIKRLKLGYPVIVWENDEIVDINPVTNPTYKPSKDALELFGDFYKGVELPQPNFNGIKEL